MENFLKKLVEQYPEQGSLILRLARADENFRAVCEEIDLAEAARVRWMDLPARAREYEEILTELTQEFQALLVRSSPAKHDGRGTD